jgi:toxin HigB-1
MLAVVIKSFADKPTEQLWVTGAMRRLPGDIARRALRKLSSIDAAPEVDVLRVPPGNRLHRLGGDRADQYAIAVNDQWRICFRFENGDAYDVEVRDYH